LGYGDRSTTYTNLVAEFIIRIFELLHRFHGSPIHLRITGSLMEIDQDENGSGILLETQEYLKRIEEYMSFAAVRRGLAHLTGEWKILDFRLRSARTWPALQICDLLSNASFTNFRKCNHTTRVNLIDAFGEYNFSLIVSDAVKSVEENLIKGNVALAIQTVAETLHSSKCTEKTRKQLETQRQKAVGMLKNYDSDTRNIQLRQIDGWVWLLLKLRNNLEKAYEIILWLDKYVMGKLFEPGDDISEKNVAWFSYALAVDALTAQNHLGGLQDAKQHFEKINNLLPELAGRWEHAPIMIGGMVTQAVHLTDCFEFDEASNRMKAVANYYENLSALLSDAMPSVFPKRVRSYNRAIALSTWMQSEALAGIEDPARLDNARGLNELAIDEFASDTNKQRQFQYRCQIETFAGNLAKAKSYLAKSLNIDSDDHDSIGKSIIDLPSFVQGFYLLHWTRIGAEAAREGMKLEVQNINSALDTFRLMHNEWIIGNDKPYPAHGIRRNFAAILASQGNNNQALSVLGRLRNLSVPVSGSRILELIKIAGRAEVAAALASTAPYRVQGIISGKDNNIFKDCRMLASKLEFFPKLSKILDRLEKALIQFEKSEFSEFLGVFKITRLIGY